MTEEKVCKCGHNKDHHMVSAERKYSGMGWFWVLFGVSAIPKRISYRCRICHEEIDFTTDPKVLRRGIA